MTAVQRHKTIDQDINKYSASFLPASDYLKISLTDIYKPTTFLNISRLFRIIYSTTDRSDHMSRMKLAKAELAYNRQL